MTDLRDLFRNVPPCGERMAYTPFWSCDLPRGHHGDHVQIAMRPFPREATVPGAQHPNALRAA